MQPVKSRSPGARNGKLYGWTLNTAQVVAECLGRDNGLQQLPETKLLLYNCFDSHEIFKHTVTAVYFSTTSMQGKQA